MTKKQIKTELPNEVDILRSTLADVKVKLPGLDAFLLANPECAKCSNSKAYHCVMLKGKPGCRTCSSRRISCTRHVQYLVETTASRLEWSVEKTRTMYDKHIKQTRSGKKSSIGKVKKIPTRKAMDVPQTVGSGSTAGQTVVEGKGGRRNVAPEEDDDYEGEGGSDYHDGPKDHESFSDLEDLIEPEDDLEDVLDMEWNENSTNNIPHSVSSVTPRTSSSKLHPLPSNPQEEFIVPALERGQTASLDLGRHDPTSLRTESERTHTAPRVDDLTQFQLENERNGTTSTLSRAQSEYTPESSMSAEQRIKQLEEKVAKLNALRLADAASMSRQEKRADNAFDNLSVLLSHVCLYRQELASIVTKNIETAHQKQFKLLIDKMDETSVSATQILMLLDKRKQYDVPKTRVPVIITDEEGQEWVPWDVISDDNSLRDRDTETETKRRRDSGADDEGSSKRRKS